jgi:hypothetical protein
MSAAERYEPIFRTKRQLTREQRRWPTLGWVIGELRWYLISILGGAGAALVAFAVYLILGHVI